MTVLNACLFGVMDSGSEEESTSKVRITVEFITFTCSQINLGNV